MMGENGMQISKETAEKVVAFIRDNYKSCITEEIQSDGVKAVSSEVSIPLNNNKRGEKY